MGDSAFSTRARRVHFPPLGDDHVCVAVISERSSQNLQSLQHYSPFTGQPHLSPLKMTYNLLAGGYRNTFAYLSFEPSSAKLKLVSESPSPENASWIEASTTKFKAPSRVLYSLSEDAEKGVAVSLELKGEEVKITQERKTNGAPAHSEVVMAWLDLTG